MLWKWREREPSFLRCKERLMFFLVWYYLQVGLCWESWDWCDVKELFYIGSYTKEREKIWPIGWSHYVFFIAFGWTKVILRCIYPFSFTEWGFKSAKLELCLLQILYYLKVKTFFSTPGSDGLLLSNSGNKSLVTIDRWWYTNYM